MNKATQSGLVSGASSCKFHPVDAAKNQCVHCAMEFCERCTDVVSVGHNGVLSEQCFICESVLEPLLAENEIQPFWSRIGDIYRYPMSTSAVITIVLVAFFSAFLQGFGLLGWVPIIAINLYSFACLRETAGGETVAPGVEASFEGSITPVIYVGLSVALATLIAGVSFSELGYGMGVLFSLLMVLVMPAIIILIAIEEELLTALNPMRFINVIKTTGSSYFVMVLFIILMLYSIEILAATFANTNFEALSIFLGALIFAYYNIVIFHIMGYLVYQHHLELGFRVSGQNSSKDGIGKKKRTQSQRHRMQMDVLIKAGKYQTASIVANRTIKDHSHIWEWERAFRLLCAATPSKNVVSFFERYIIRLSLENDYERIADAYLILCRAIPNVVVENDRYRILISTALIHMGHHVKAIKLIQTLPNESEQPKYVGDALELLITAFKNVDGGENAVEKFRNMRTAHFAKIGVEFR